MNAFLVYLLFVVTPNLAVLAALVFSVAAIASIVCTAMVTFDLVDNGSPSPREVRWLKLSIVITAISAFVVVVLPSEEQIIKVAAIYYGTNIEGIDELPPNMVRYLNELLAEAKVK